eukprot:m.727724 g.727724  ORF g.727724 m.727724 type:complete len:112 (-) comp58863_c2_seq1:59-394(-)
MPDLSFFRLCGEGNLSHRDACATCDRVSPAGFIELIDDLGILELKEASDLPAQVRRESCNWWQEACCSSGSAVVKPLRQIVDRWLLINFSIFLLMTTTDPILVVLPAGPGH